MLIEVSIRDFAIIDELRLSFEPGLNVMTGETGAGKSIIIDALGAVLGERIGTDVVRSGAKAARRPSKQFSMSPKCISARDSSNWPGSSVSIWTKGR